MGELLDSAMDPTISYEDLEIIRGLWPGKLVVKGVQTLEDSKTFTDLGVDGIILSNHGGRQLDRAPVPSTCSRRSPARSAPTPRSASTPASCTARTSWPPWPSAHGSP